MLWSCFFPDVLTSEEKDIQYFKMQLPAAKQGAPQIIGVVDPEFADSKIYSFYLFNINHCQTKA